MNLSNQKLLKGIKIFFKAIYILLIVVFCFNLLSQVILLFSDKEPPSTLTVIHVIEKPDVTMNIAGKAVQPELMVGMGAVLIKGVPTLMKVSNVLVILIALFIYILILRTIRSIIKSIDQNEVFSLLNAQRLKKAGYLLLIELILSYTITLINSFAIQSFNAASLGSFIGVAVGEASGHFVAIVFVFFIAAVFKIGVNMQEENQSFV
jgi:hypothetical protein